MSTISKMKPHAEAEPRITPIFRPLLDEDLMLVGPLALGAGGLGVEGEVVRSIGGQKTTW